MEFRRFFGWILILLASGFVTCSEITFENEWDAENILSLNHDYKYHFRSEALSQAVGTTEDHGKIIIECDVHIAHVQECLYRLHLSDCYMTAAGGEPESQTAWMDHQALPDLSRHSIVFCLMNGEVREIKASKDDPIYFINIKKGVLSAFVFKFSQTEKEMHENHIDIHGSCPLTSVVEGKTVRTSKDMLHCKFPSRPDWQFSPWSIFWNMSFIQNVINSTTDCEYQISDTEKRIEKVFCKERHAIMLESTHRTTTAVQTNVLYNLDFVKSEARTERIPLPVLTKQTDIRFEYEDTPVPQSYPPNFLANAKKMLADLVMDSINEVKLFTIPQFTNFVAWIRTSYDLKEFVESVKDCSFMPAGVQCDQKIKDLSHSYLSDALLQCNSLPCMDGLASLALKNDLSSTFTNLMFYSWSYMHYSKPGFITNFMNLCTSKTSHQCWLSLGSFIRRIYSRNYCANEKVLEEVRMVANHFTDGIEESCDVTEDAEKLLTDCLIYIKAASHLGKYYIEIVPKGLDLLLDVATDEHAAVVVRTSALEALKEVQDQQNLVYDRLLPLLKNSSLPASIQILSYDTLILAFKEHHFEEHLLNILKDEKNAEVKYYIADSLNSLMTDHEFRSKRIKFLNSMNDLLQENGLTLEWILYETKGKSKTTIEKLFLNIPLLPDYLKRFGIQMRDSYIYDAYIYPTLFNQKALLQLFSTYIPAAKLSAYFEGWEEVILAYRKNLGDMDSKPFSFSKCLEALKKTAEEYGHLNEDSLRYFDENILSSIRKLHTLYWEHHKKLDPYSKAYMDLFGSTVRYYILDNLKSSENNGIGKLLHSVAEKLAEGVTYDATKVIRIIEAYHQVPTMMGLPLNWTTNATLAFSVRAGLKYQVNVAEDEIHSSGFLQPSVALTFLNRMVLDFPTITQIGVQANSSGYSSTEFQGKYTSAKGKQTIRFDRPNRTQKILELFRTNQLIKHNSYEDIPDWDIERTSSAWCSKDNSTSGVRFCLDKSYPAVTPRIKPWALMAGWCKWRFYVLPTSSNEVHYDLEWLEESKPMSKEFNAKFSVSERDKEKSAYFKAVVDENNKDLKIDLSTTLIPGFSAALSRSEVWKNKKMSGHKTEAALKFSKDFEYRLKFSDETKIQKSSVESSSSSDENSDITINLEHLDLKTPYSAYAWNKTIVNQGEDSKAEATLYYENTNSKSDWMKGILPSAYWENDKKASLKIHLHWKKPIYGSQDTVTRQTEFRFEMPRYIMTVNGLGYEASNRQQMAINFAKKDVNRGKLDAFLNFTYDYWSNENNEDYNKAIRLVNVTIPQRSWSAQFQHVREGLGYQHELTLKRAVLKTKNGLKSNYVGWWTEDVSDHFRIEEKEIKLIADHEILHHTGEELAKKFSTVSVEDLTDLRNQLIASSIVIRYPFKDKEESVIFDGNFISSRNSTVNRFQKNFDLTSTYNNLKLTSHSVSRSDEKDYSLYHNSYFTHTTTDTKAYNTIHYAKKNFKGRCKDVVFQHEIRSHVFDLTTDVTYKCETEVDGLNTLRLTLNTNSSKWNMLDMKLNQIIEDVSPSHTREEMTAAHVLGTIHVDAEWYTNPKHSEKQVILCSKEGNCPNAELSIESWSDQKIIKFNRNDYEISYQRKMSSDNKNVHISVGYGQKEEGVSDVLDLTGELLAPNYHVWKGTLNADAYDKVKEIFVSGYKRAQSAFAEISADKDHPLNEMLRPALKMTLYDYWKSSKTQFQEFMCASWTEVKGIVHTVDAFTQSAYVVLINSITKLNRFCVTSYNSLKEKSVTIWAISYFNVPYYIQQGFYSLPQALGELWNQLALGEKNIIHFKFITGRFIALSSFLEWPSLSFSPAELTSTFLFKSKAVRPNNLVEDRKVAMIFGPLHVYTFDGHLYDIPEYPHPDCTFLLAHDVHKSLFTVFSSQKGIHLLFPEMSITINDENEVFINGTQKPSSIPIQADNGKVTVTRGQVVEVWTPSLSVVCRSRDFLCVLKLSNYHTGGIIGLLGNADEHSTNDFMLPNGNTSNLLEFARSYEISGESECKNLVVKSPHPPSEEDARTCSQKFADVCLWQYRLREKFLKACQADVAAGHGPCYSAAGLSALCNLKHMQSQTECFASKQENVNIGRRLEVVLVVQESKYLTSSEKSSSPAKGIENLIKALNDKFKADGYESVTFSLLGFGGTGVHYRPSIHSFGKELWLPAEAMINNVLKTLEFKSRESADSVEALKYALEELGHDTFNSKVFIVISTKDKQVADKSILDSIQKDLEENGITLYTFSSYPSIEKGKKVYGVRADGLIFPSQSKGGDAYLDYPRGNLAKLTSSTRGSLFLVKFLRENKPPSFFTEFAQEVWAKVNKESRKCRGCKTVRRSWWWYRNECNIVDC